MVVTHSLAWLSVCLSNPQPHNIIFYVANGMVFFAGLLEVKDFPPLCETPTSLPRPFPPQHLTIYSVLSSIPPIGPEQIAGRGTPETDTRDLPLIDHCAFHPLCLPWPGGFLDAHAAWHAATPLLSYAFYYFWLADGRANLQVVAAKAK